MSISRRAFIGSTVVAVGIASTGSARALSSIHSRATSSATAKHGARLVPTAIELPLESARVVAVHPIRFGALPVVIEHAGHRFQVDVFRRSARGARGVVDTHNVSVFVSNRGDGSTETGTAKELGARALALALESDGTAARLAGSLLTFEERARTFPNRAYALDAV